MVVRQADAAFMASHARRGHANPGPHPSGVLLACCMLAAPLRLGLPCTPATHSYLHSACLISHQAVFQAVDHQPNRELTPVTGVGRASWVQRHSTSLTPG